ncbi:MAG: hypothetical protein EHM72_05835, partial [Calditrichaeota bacterium]
MHFYEKMAICIVVQLPIAGDEEMRKKTIIFLLAGIIGVIVLPLLAADAQYVGSRKCMMCHKSESRGNQYGKWLESPHAKSYETLKSDASKAIAKKMGIEDPTTADKCLKCHITGHGVAAAVKAEGFEPTLEGVGCESCHGPGSLYKSMTIMKALNEGKQDAKAVAFVEGDEAVCLRCHNSESPTFKPFDYQTQFNEIAHNLPP